MDASISVFKEMVELHFDSNVVHGLPASSTRAELFGVIMALSCDQVILNNQTYDEFELYGYKLTSIAAINQPDELDVRENLELIHEIDFIRQQIGAPVNTTYIKSHQDLLLLLTIFQLM